MTEIHITVSPGGYSPTAQFWNVSVDGRHLCRGRSRFTAAARALVAEGADPNAVLVMRHSGSDTVALTAPIGMAARLTVNESTQAPRFVRWSPREWPETVSGDDPTAI